MLDVDFNFNENALTAKWEGDFMATPTLGKDFTTVRLYIDCVQ